MSYSVRGPVPAGLYHVWRRTTGPILMFRDDFDRTAFSRRLFGSIKKYAWSCLAFVLMPTHFHLVLEVGDDVLPPGMRDLFGPYAQQFNRRWGRSGHLRAAPYRLRRIEGDTDLLGTVRYVARNPVRDRLCTLPQEWAWGSYRGTAGYERPFPFVDDRLVLGPLHEDVALARQLIRAVVEPGL